MPAHTDGHLRELVVRIADGDRAAFRDLYGRLASQVWQDTLTDMTRTADARAVTRLTFVEVWHLAARHVHDPALDTHTWIAAIAARHADERLRTEGTAGAVRAEYDRHTHRELVALLGVGSGVEPPRSTGLPVGDLM
jgi:hypothetical protein